ncbi:hypothetical protein GVN20_18570 [Runella sp. CRIBMP]|uniref:hypothetical protein n=1 Tax=Runella sp. CRIBMP TaxID=2683261 RepID=UPI0014130A9B|nr:hypothetical protein [Runella sp. CRIBMP]NBB21377.1 hypothetical protein [Runella sp. CRIBMP]
MKKFYWASIVALFIGLMSCKNEENLMMEQTSTNSKDVIMVDGRLKFKNHRVFHRMIKDLQENGIEKLASEFPDFKSMAQAFKELSDKDLIGNSNSALLKTYQYVYKTTFDNNGEKSIERAVTGPLLSSILNHEGLIQIGDNLLRMNDEKVLSTDIRYISELEIPKSKFVEEHKVVNVPLQISSPNARLKWDEEDVLTEYDPIGGGSKRRFKRLYFARNYFNGIDISGNGYDYMLEAGISMSHQRKNWWGWGAVDTDGWEIGSGFFSFSGAVSGYLGITASTYSGSTSARGVLYVQPNAGGNVYSHVKVNYIQANKNGGGSYNSGVLEFFN